MAIAPLTTGLAYVTADLPGIGGILKQRPDDFLVEENPLYEPSGTGEHLYLFIEKTQQTTTDVIRRLAKLFRVKRSDIGYAGLKDKHAITRQHFSVYLPNPKNDEKYLSRFEFLPFKLLWSQRHHSKLRRGHLSTNRFQIRIRSVDPAAVVTAKRALDRLSRSGVPNYVGHQRFGYRQNNHVLGCLLIQVQWQALLDQMLGQPEKDHGSATTAGRIAYQASQYADALDHWPHYLRHDRQALDALRQGKSAQEAVIAIEAQQREFMLSAAQSAIFNQVLDHRIRDPALPGFERLMEGDLAWEHENRAVFVVDQLTAEKENGPSGRVRALQVSPSGPMWGSRMLKAQGEPGRSERRALYDLGLTEDQINTSANTLLRGTRRPMRVPLRDPQVSGGADAHGPYVNLTFELPRGAYATVVLREIMKCDDQPANELAESTYNT